jgi:hypothetical protein
VNVARARDIFVVVFEHMQKHFESRRRKSLKTTQQQQDENKKKPITSSIVVVGLFGVV